MTSYPIAFNSAKEFSFSELCYVQIQPEMTISKLELQINAIHKNKSRQRYKLQMFVVN